MTQLSRLATLALGKEGAGSPGTYVVPTASVPFLKADFEDTTLPIEDKSYRNNDTELQGLYPGPQDALWDIDVLAYPDLIGHFLRGTIGPDTVTAATSTTLSASTLVGATSISTVVSLPAGTVVQIDTAGNLEYAITDGAATGPGPFVSNVTTVAGQIGANRVGLAFAHASSVAVVTQTIHTFKQNATAAKATYSLTVFDTLTYRGYTSAVMSDLALKVDPKGALNFNVKLMAFPGSTQASFVPAYSTFDPLLGWSWNMTNGGAASTRGKTYDVNIKRVCEAIHSSDGIQAPREIFQGPLSVDGAYKAIFENQLDLQLFAQYTQSPTTATLTQPVNRGGMSLAVTMSKSGWYKGKRNLTGTYVEADYSLHGVFNATDAGGVSAVLSNFTTAAF
jgi:hypothetical protein